MSLVVWQDTRSIYKSTIFPYTRKEKIINSRRNWGIGMTHIHYWSVQFRGSVQLFQPMDCSMSGFPVHHQPPELTMSIKSVMPSNHLILCHPLLLLPSVFPSTRVFSSESVLGIRWPKYWSFSVSISPSNEYSGLISFRIDWLDLLAVQGTLKSLLQHPVQKHRFFGTQLSL